MRTGLKLGVVVFAAAFGSAPVQGQPLPAATDLPPLVFFADKDYPPLSFVRDGKPAGLDVDLAYAMAGAIGREVRVQVMDWNEAQARALRGEADGLLSMSRTPQRLALYEFSRSTVTHDFGLFVRRGDTAITDIADLARRNVAVTAGGQPHSFLGRNVEANLVIVENYDDGFARLADGRVDAVAADVWVGAHTLEQRGIEDIVRLGSPFETLPGGIAVPKSRRELVPQLNQAIGRLEADGTVQALRARWRPEEIVFVSVSQFNQILALSGLGVFALLVGGGIVLRSRSHHVRARRALEAELHRTAAFTRQLLLVSRKPASSSVFEVNTVIRGLEPLLRQVVGDETALVMKPGRGEWHIEADPGQIEQLIMKLAINARDAMGSGGRLTIDTDTVWLDDKFVRTRGGRTGGDFVTIGVTDTGSRAVPGVMDEIVHGIVKDAGGCLVVESTPGGAIFRVFLPRVDGNGVASRTLDEHRPDELDSAEAVLRSLAMMVEARDAYTDGHCQRLAEYAVRLGQRLQLPHDDLVTLRRGGYFHDIGKVGIPDSILMKPGALTPEEYSRLKEHPLTGERLCGNLRVLHRVRPIVRWHHELLDGSGYPDGLRGDAIPLLAQIIGIVDVFDALTTSRPYRAALTVEQARSHLLLDVKAGRRSAWLVNEFFATLRGTHAPARD